MRVAKPSIEEPDAEEPARPDPWGTGVSNGPGLPDRDQLSMPAAEGIGRDQGVQVTAYPSPEARGLCGQAPALGVGEPETARTERLSVDAILFLERVNDVTLLLVDPARDGQRRGTETLGEKATYGASRAEALGGHERRDPASVQRRISPVGRRRSGSWTVRACRQLDCEHDPPCLTGSLHDTGGCRWVVA